MHPLLCSNLHSFIEANSVTHILHISSSFIYSKLYLELVDALHACGVNQTIFTPLRKSNLTNVSIPEYLSGKFFSPSVLKYYHSFFFRARVHDIVQSVISSVDLSSITIIHAHFLYTDGAVALSLHKKFSIPYICTIRNTDLNVYKKYRRDLDSYMYEILARAKHVVFLTPSYKETFLSKLPLTLSKVIEAKSVVISNGILPFWLKNTSPTLPHISTQRRSCMRALYVGDFSPNKNLARLILALQILRNNSFPISLTIVGGWSKKNNFLGSLVLKFLMSRSWVLCLGKIYDDDLLKTIYQDHDLFLMPSITETFGLVYLEALSQGLPVLCSKGQGIDGFFPSNTVVELVNPLSIPDIARGIRCLMSKLDSVSSLQQDFLHPFLWSEIAKKYLSLYSN